jgi:hypothetical protein
MGKHRPEDRRDAAIASIVGSRIFPATMFTRCALTPAVSLLAMTSAYGATPLETQNVAARAAEGSR